MLYKSCTFSGSFSALLEMMVLFVVPYRLSTQTNSRQNKTCVLKTVTRKVLVPEYLIAEVLGYFQRFYAAASYGPCL